MLSLVTGGAGFVGSAVVRTLLMEDTQVRVLVRRSTDLRNLEGLDVEICYGDLMDQGSLHEAMGDSNVVYHVAALYSTDESDSHRMYETNIEGTKNVLRAAMARGVSKVVHTSTIGTIGRPSRAGVLPDEETPFCQWQEASPYAKSKHLAEVAALGFAEDGLQVVVVNPCAPVGPGDIKPSSTGKRIVDYLRGVRPSFVPGGINFVAVEDVAKGHVLAAKLGRVGERYILGHAHGNLSEADFLSAMEQASGLSLPGRSERGMTLGVGRRMVRDVRRGLRRALRGVEGNSQIGHMPAALTCNPSKAITELGLPQTPLPLAFERAVRWFREHDYV